MDKYYPRGDKLDTLNVAAYVEGQIMAEVLRRCGVISRKTFLEKATKLGDWKAPMLRDSVVVRTDPGNYDIFRSMQLLRFDGEQNRRSPFRERGDVPEVVMAGLCPGHPRFRRLDCPGCVGACVDARHEAGHDDR